VQNVIVLLTDLPSQCQFIRRNSSLSYKWQPHWSQNKVYLKHYPLLQQ